MAKKLLGLPSMTDNSERDLMLPHEIMPDQEVLDHLELEKEEYGDFQNALEIITLQAQGLSLAEAAREVGVERRNLYRSKWQRLLAKAMRLVVGEASLDARIAAKLIMDSWAAVVRSQIHVALHAERGSDRTAAAEFLKGILDEVGTGEQTDTAQADYVRGAGSASFNPMAPIQISQLTINNYGDAGDSLTETIDAVARPVED